MSIIKPPEAQTNTYLVNVSGIRAYGQDHRDTDFEVRFTSDEYGESLSLTNGNRQWLIPYEPVEKLVKHTRSAKETTNQQRKICGSCQYYEALSGKIDEYSCRFGKKTTPYGTCEKWLGL